MNSIAKEYKEKHASLERLLVCDRLRFSLDEQRIHGVIVLSIYLHSNSRPCYHISHHALYTTLTHDAV